MSRLVGFLVFAGLIGTSCYFANQTADDNEKYRRNQMCHAPANEPTLLRFPARGQYLVYRELPIDVEYRYRRVQRYEPPAVSGAQLVNQKTSQLIRVNSAFALADNPGHTKLGSFYISAPGLYSMKGTPENARGTLVVVRD